MAHTYASASTEAGLDTRVYDRLLRERILFLGSVVEDSNANAICAQLLLLAAEDPNKDIYLYINSPGGSVTAGMAIYDTMQFVPNDIVTVGIGMAASMGQLLLTAGTKGKRYITPNARVLLHQPHHVRGGDWHVARHAARTAVAGRTEDALDQLRLHALPHQRVLASARPDDEDLHSGLEVRSARFRTNPVAVDAPTPTRWCRAAWT